MKARVENGRLVLNEQTDLPNGTEVELVPADWWDDLDDADRQRLEAALAQSEADVKNGRLVPAAELLARLRGLA